jgi:DNA-binding NarL/FixJ family response regulator
MFRGYVVEDNAPARAALVEGLAELAAVTTVGYAGDETSAVAWLNNPANDWDIAIIDLDLGSGGSGYRVLHGILKRQPHQLVVVWTVTADEMARERCRMLGADRVFDRTSELSQLMDFCMQQSEAQVRAVAGSGRFPPPPRTPARQPPAVTRALLAT